ncbi:acetyl-CoA C-acetyltransferase [Gilvimarinus agarilyticus]|uniref:acetyl-CoA C-acetyltransferase n=1 Tax=Gilvimarinus sp. 2_MG-2023 TaxID=3062666 RepID=UPI001C07FDBB|nr:acetyl-CoA C-acetyltransferase [Gilvimarinus sp. 2_MG-2023]MBU2886539.1 acetyl-CoA C-acetyltransferase [Gilvimarinus agarilyticus]MDO6571207.1 acetyl-CoA C-acetyltransferase [Gilvimarinus sp. 2_MG-2023]
MSPTTKAAERARPVYLVDGARTPFIKARGKPGPFSPVDLAVQSGRALLQRHALPSNAFDQVILGCVNVIASEMNPARIAALRLGLSETTPAFTMQINCGSGMQSIDTAYRYIREGRQDLVLAGGTEALSHAPLMLTPHATQWLAELGLARSLPAKLKQLSSFKLNYLKPVLSLKLGLTDPVVELNMGQTAEVVANLFNISRQEADEYAVASHLRLHRAQEEGWLNNEVVPLFAPDGSVFSEDDGVRPDSAVEKLAKLRPVFERPYGKVTAGNSSQITDGASWLMLASEEALEKHQLTPIAQIKDSEWSGLEPEIMGLGPAVSAGRLALRNKMTLDDIDLLELNEAFAAQVLGCLKAWNDPDFCQAVFNSDQVLGQFDTDKLNIDGGAISMGHPVGTSGNRIVLHLMNALKRNNLKRGIATQCIGGGQAGAMLIELV